MVWGRGAVDMLNLTASMAVAFRRLADSGFKPKGTISYLAVADEEARGVWGADWLIDHVLDDVKADYVITESGGFQVPTDERGAAPGHGRGEGHLLVGAHDPRHAGPRVVAVQDRQRAHHRGRGRAPAGRVPAAAELSRTWRRLVEGLGLPDELLVEESFRETIDQMPLGFGRIARSCTATTFAPTVVHGGTKTNVIPDKVQLEVDIRTLPGQGSGVRRLLLEAIGDLIDKVDIGSGDDPSSRSEIDTPSGARSRRSAARLCRGSALVPWLMTGATDNRFFRRAGSVGYGFGLFSKKLKFEDYATMFHGNDERVDQGSLGLSTDLWLAIAEEFVGPHSGWRAAPRPCSAQVLLERFRQVVAARDLVLARRASSSSSSDCSSSVHVEARISSSSSIALSARPPRLAGHAELAQVERPAAEDPGNRLRAGRSATGLGGVAT